MSTDKQRKNADATFRNDVLRAPFYGILEAGWSTFSLIIAIRYFEAPDTYKAAIAGSAPMGLLLTPVSLYLAAKIKARPSRACAWVLGMSGLLLAGAGVAESLLVFTLLIILSEMIAVQQGTFMVQIYSENYSSKERGSRVTTPFMLTATSAILFSFIAGRILDADIDNFRLVLAVMMGAGFVAAWKSRKIPSIPLTRQHIGNPWQNFSLIWKDRFFGYILASWMLLGMGNLISIPIRVEYLANPAYGINANNTTIALLLLVVPATARIVSTKLWGFVFDRLHFITTRNLLNACFLCGISLFFFSRSYLLLTMAMIFIGLAMGGGKIFWNLWVTKIAPPEKAASYMSIHMALTGFRGTLAPFIGYWILSHSAPTSVAITGMILISLSMILFECVRNHPRLRPEV